MNTSDIIIDNKIYTYTFNDDIVYVSLNNNSVYIKIENQNIKKEYERTIDIRDLSSPFGKDYTFQIILNCFAKSNPNYILLTKTENNVFILNFNHIYMNFLETSFSINLIEKDNNEKKDFIDIVEKHDNEIDILKKQIALITETYESNLIYFEKIIKEQKIKINKLNSIIDSIGNIVIKINKHCNKTDNEHIYLPIKSKELNLILPYNIEKIHCFYCLDKLSLQTSYTNINFENNNLKHIIFNEGNITSLEGIEKLPNLEILEFNKCKYLENIKSYLLKTKIKKIIFNNCGENQKRNLITYCKAKNIELIYS